MGSLGAEGPSAATVARPNGYGLETRASSRAMAKACLNADPSAISTHHKPHRPPNRRIRKRNDRREVPGRVGRVKEGWGVPIRPGCSVRASG